VRGTAVEGEGARRCRRGGTWPLAGRAGVWNFRNAGAKMLFFSPNAGAEIPRGRSADGRGRTDTLNMPLDRR